MQFNTTMSCLYHICHQIKNIDNIQKNCEHLRALKQFPMITNDTLYTSIFDLTIFISFN